MPIARPQFRRQAVASPIEQQQRVIAGGLEVAGEFLITRLEYWRFSRAYCLRFTDDYFPSITLRM